MRYRSVVMVGAMIAAALVGCSSSRRAGTASANSGVVPPTTSAGAETFGDLASPCGPGNASGATDKGVTNTAIHIGYGDDRGFPASPGLDAAMGDAVTAMIKWCNAQGGILGRKIIGDYYDAAVTQVVSVMQRACLADFMLVGEGWALDEAAEETRLECNLPAVPGFAVGPDFANGPEEFQSVPNPDDYVPASIYYQAAQLFPTQIKQADFLHTTLGATETSIAKAQDAEQAVGFHILNCGVKVAYTGEPNYQPFAQEFKTCGAQLIFTNSGPNAIFENFMTAMGQLGVHPIILAEENVYSPQLAAWNTAGLGNQIYAREAFQPLENASKVKALRDYEAVLAATGGMTSQLGEQSASSFLLWATEAKSCGSNLTRQCMINALSQVHSWTGGGLHASGDPGRNLPPDCGMIVKLTNTTWSQFYPKALGQFDCNPKYVFHVSPADWGTTLNAQRMATKFLGPNVLMPQS
jgi:hypothetical protein